MPYPTAPTASTDFALEAQAGNAPDGTLLEVELRRIRSILSQLRAFVMALATANKKWQPASALSMTVNERFDYTATASQTSFLFTGGITANTSTDYALVFSAGVLLRSADVTLATTGVTIPAQTAGTAVSVLLFQDADGVRTDLASNTSGKGAALIGIEDQAGDYSATDLEGALEEIKAEFKSTRDLIATKADVILRTGSVAFTADQSMGGNKLTNLAAGVAGTDAATVAQLNAVSSIYNDLTTQFLQLSGGVMSGALNLNNNLLLNVPTPTADTHGANKKYVDDSITTLSDTSNSLYLAKTGGQLLGALDVNGQQLNNLIAATQPAQPMRKDQVEAAISAALGASSGVAGDIGGSGIDGALTTLGSGGHFEATSVTVGTAQTLTIPTELKSQGAIAFTNTISASKALVINSNSTVNLGGNINASQFITPTRQVTIRAKGDITISGTIDADVLIVETQGDALLTADINCSEFYARTGGTFKFTGTMTLGHRDTTPLDGDSFSSGVSGASGGSGGHGGIGSAGASAAAPAASDFAGGANTLLRGTREFGGQGGAGSASGGVTAYGGGICVIYSVGNIDLSGSAIVASGQDFFGSNNDGMAGGGGGTVIIASKGSITNPTVSADGGDGENNTRDGGSGGGGRIHLIASSYGGTTTVSVAKGGGPATGSAANGTSDTDTLTVAQIEALDAAGAFDIP